jgi:hypothetical protein
LIRRIPASRASQLPAVGERVAAMLTMRCLLSAIEPAIRCAGRRGLLSANVEAECPECVHVCICHARVAYTLVATIVRDSGRFRDSM